MPPTQDSWSLADLQEVIARHWGFRQLRPLQEQAMRAVLDGRDSLVVLPTGGGKSLCYQAPAVLRGGTTLVVSPLISLMKDQVDGLRACGIAAAQLDSSMTAGERFAYEMDLRQGEVRLLFVSPERLVQTEYLYKLLRQIDVRTVAIDEAHCISHWGHDFRPEYRQLSKLREYLPGANVHAYTATATEQVRQDIITQLALRDPAVLIGNFDRPNLTYRVLTRQSLSRQVREVLDRHPGEAGIIYCLSRREVDKLAAALKEQGVKAMPYHAGMPPEERQATQEAFAAERCDVVVATVAFGMGIDRSNVRFVLHTAMPKSLEHYQQETGRAGRDGLEAECVLLRSGHDFFRLKSMLEKSASESAADPSFLPNALKHLEDMDRYGRGAVCRHKALVSYFGQKYETASCGACDLCLGDTQEVHEAQVVAQKILSCVARVKGGFGIGHVTAVLRGQDTENVRRRGHDRLSTYGLLSAHSEADLRDWVYQLIGQGVLLQTDDEYPKLRLNGGSWEVMRGQRQVRLVQLVRRKKGEKPARSQVAEVSWEGVETGLFAALRELRLKLAGDNQVPPYVIFGDRTLREMARVRPSTPEHMRPLYGVGEAKLRRFGEPFLAAITEYCRQHRLPLDAAAPSRQAAGVAPSLPFAAEAPAPPVRVTPRHETVFELFRQGASVEDVMRLLTYKRSTVVDYLTDYIRAERPASIASWVDRTAYYRVVDAVRRIGAARLKAIFLDLGEKVDYDAIRLVVAHLQAQADELCPP